MPWPSRQPVVQSTYTAARQAAVAQYIAEVNASYQNATPQILPVAPIPQNEPTIAATVPVQQNEPIKTVQQNEPVVTTAMSPISGARVEIQQESTPAVNATAGDTKPLAADSEVKMGLPIAAIVSGGLDTLFGGGSGVLGWADSEPQSWDKAENHPELDFYWGIDVPRGNIVRGVLVPRSNLVAAMIRNPGDGWYAPLDGGPQAIKDRKYPVVAVLAGADFSTAVSTGVAGISAASFSWSPRSLGLSEGSGYNPIAWPKPWVNNTGRTITAFVAGQNYEIRPGQVIYQYNGAAPVLGAIGSPQPTANTGTNPQGIGYTTGPSGGTVQVSGGLLIVAVLAGLYFWSK